MNWYLAKLVFRIVCGDGKHSAQFDEQLRLIVATDKQEALQKAIETGRKGNDEFYNKKEQKVQWQFINVSELHVISELSDGAEIYSRIEEKENGESYEYTVHQKAESLQQTLADHYLTLA